MVTRVVVKNAGDSAALVFRTYGCPYCEERFELCQRRNDPPPSFCPACGKRVSGIEAVPAKVAIGGSTAARSVDETYRMLENAGAARARLAERDGATPEQARSLKITNMHDNMREGDVAAVRPSLPNNETTHFMREAERRGIQYGFGGGMGLTPSPGSAPVRVAPPITTAQGTYTGPGHIGLQAAQMEHRKNVAAVVAGGRRMPTR